MEQTEADKLLELYHKNYEVFYDGCPCELYDDGTFYCRALGDECDLTEYNVEYFEVKQDVSDWVNL